MNYARSYATLKRQRPASRNYRRYTQKRRIEKLYFRSGNYRKKPRSWRWLKVGLLRLGYFVTAATIIAGFSLLLVFAYQLLLTLPYFCLKGPEAITITGVQRSQPHKVLQELQIRPGASLLAIQPLKLERALRQQPWVAQVELRRQWPDRLSLHIKEHQPWAIVQLEKLYLMNREGYLFKVWEPQDPSDLPVITGLSQEHFRRVGREPTPLLAKLFEFIHFLQENRHEINLATVGEIHVDPEHGFVIYPFGLKAGIHLGFKDYPQKLAKLEKIWPYLKQQGALAAVERIDLNYPQRVLVSLRRSE